MYFTNMKNLHEDEWENTVDVNCKGVMFGVGAVLAGMIQRGSGHIVNISSDAGRRVFPTLAVYSASKHFVEAFSEGLRREVVGTGLKVSDNVSRGTFHPWDCAWSTTSYVVCVCVAVPLACMYVGRVHMYRDCCKTKTEHNAASWTSCAYPVSEPSNHHRAVTVFMSTVYRAAEQTRIDTHTF